MLDPKGLEAAARKLRNAEKEKFGSWPDADDSRSIAAAVITAYLSSVQAEPVAWEHFCDHSYYDMWCVRQKDAPKRFGDGYHVTSEAEAKSLAERLSTAALAEREPVAVAVKPLEWSEAKALGGGRKLLAFDCFGNEFHRIDLPKDAEAVHREQETAQRRYDRCIRSALVATPPAEPVVEALDAFERLLTYGRRPEGAGTTFKFQGGGYFFLSDKDAITIRAALAAKDGRS